MSRSFSVKCVSSTISETLISATSAVVFFLLDIADVIMCFFFRFLDEFIEGEPSSCYCGNPENDECCGGMSESLRGRKNAVRNMIPRICNKNGRFCGEKKMKRWSDCGCERCVSWMKNVADYRLHLVVKDPQTDKLENNDQEIQNVIFLHGFLSSSSLWTETIFPHLSENQNYRLFAIDLLGFGRSPKPLDCFYTLNDHLEMIEKSVIVQFKLKSYHLVAHSMGCVVALALAAKYSESMKSITLIAPPYFSSSRGDVCSEALRRLAPRRVWPPLLFGSAFMSWYEHLGRCVCFFVCRNHRIWEWILKIVTGRRNLHFGITDITRHTHHSAWHSMHNVVCGGMRFVDAYLDTLTKAGVKIYVAQGSKDQVVPVECSFNMKMKAPLMELHIVPNADHTSVIFDRVEEFSRDLERFWALSD